MKLYLRHKNTNTRFEVVKLDRGNKIITLKGQFCEFDEPYDPARFKSLGYVIEQEAAKETEDALQP